MNARLYPVYPKASMKPILIDVPMVIGRSQDADLTVASKKISREHCEIDEYEGALVLRDLDSHNGTVLNGRQIDEAIIRPGDKFSIGPFTFVVIYDHSGDFPVLADYDDDEDDQRQAAPARPAPKKGPDDTAEAIEDDEDDDNPWAFLEE